MSKPSIRTIKKSIKALREIIDTDNDLITIRLAWVVENTLRWISEDTVDWDKPENEVITNADILRQELKAEKYEKCQTG